jgi:hypothetical protein
MILRDKPLISEVVLSHCGWGGSGEDRHGLELEEVNEQGQW